MSVLSDRLMKDCNLQMSISCVLSLQGRWHMQIRISWAWPGSCAVFAWEGAWSMGGHHQCGVISSWHASATLLDSPACVSQTSLRLWASSPPPHTPALAMPSAQKYSYSSGGINAFTALIGRDSRSGKENQNMVEWTERILGSHWQM